MKFCSECGTKYIGAAKFCGECGHPRGSEPPSKTGVSAAIELDWQTFKSTYLPKRNHFAEINEAFDGHFFPSWGAVGDWASFEELATVWTVLSKEEELKPLTCKSGRWTGPNAVGYFVCEKETPSDTDLEFSIPENYVNFQGYVLVLDRESQKWRPCAYRLKGDTTSGIKPGSIVKANIEDEFHRDWATESKFNRAKSQVMLRTTIDDEDRRDTLAQKLDSRYFRLCSAPMDGWSDLYVDEYEPLEESYLVGSDLDEYENLLMFNSPVSGDYSEAGGRCSICDAEEDKDFDQLSAHSCMDGDIGYFGFASFDQNSKLQYIQANIPLAIPQDDEASFRLHVLPYLLREFKHDNISGFDHFERQESEMADDTFQLCFKRGMFAWDKLTKACGRCYKYNPESAQVCYSCCNLFVARLDGQLFASIIRDVDTGQIAEMEPGDFAAWVNIFYYVTESKSEISWVIPSPLPSDDLAVKISNEVAQLIGEDGFFNFDVSASGMNWIFSGWVTGDHIQLSLSGKHFPMHVFGQLTEQGWESVKNEDVQMFDLIHSFVDEEDCLDSITYGLSWLQELAGVKPENWVSDLEVHLGA